MLELVSTYFFINLFDLGINYYFNNTVNLSVEWKSVNKCNAIHKQNSIIWPTMRCNKFNFVATYQIGHTGIGHSKSITRFILQPIVECSKGWKIIKFRSTVQLRIYKRTRVIKKTKRETLFKWFIGSEFLVKFIHRINFSEFTLKQSKETVSIIYLLGTNWGQLLSYIMIFFIKMYKIILYYLLIIEE